jgi:RNA 2',3'-cyclic 3'-phosphodiesterase
LLPNAAREAAPELRLFFGVGLDEAATGAARRLQAELREHGARARWIAAGNLHLTLRFIGATAPTRLPALLELLERSAAAHPPCRLRACSLDRWSRLLVVEFDAEPVLQGLVDSLERGLQRQGCSAEPRAFRPHLTLARGLAPASGRAAAPLECPALEIAVEHLALFESQATANGVRYVRRGERPLTG